jgi:hypothetical protein
MGRKGGSRNTKGRRARFAKRRRDHPGRYIPIDCPATRETVAELGCELCDRPPHHHPEERHG